MDTISSSIIWASMWICCLRIVLPNTLDDLLVFLMLVDLVVMVLMLSGLFVFLIRLVFCCFCSFLYYVLYAVSVCLFVGLDVLLFKTGRIEKVERRPYRPNIWTENNAQETIFSLVACAMSFFLENSNATCQAIS